MRVAGLVVTVALLVGVGSSLAVTAEMGEFDFLMADSAIVKSVLRFPFDFIRIVATRDSAYITTVGDLRFDVGGGDVDFNGASVAGVGATDMTTLTVDTLTVDSLITFLAGVGGVLDLDLLQSCDDAYIEVLQVDTIIGSSPVTVNDSLFVVDHAQFNTSVDVVDDMIVGDTLGVGTASPEWQFHVVDAGIISMFETDDDDEVYYVAINTGDDNKEVGIKFMRQDVAYWTIEDSNGTFLIYDVNDNHNRFSINESTGAVTVYYDFAVQQDAAFVDSVYIGGNVATDGNLDDVQAESYNFATASEVSGDGDSIVVNFATDIPTLAAGATIEFVAEAANTGAADIYVDGVQKDIYEASDLSELDANDIKDGMYVILKYDGTQFQQVSQSGN